MKNIKKNFETGTDFVKKQTYTLIHKIGVNFWLLMAIFFFFSIFLFFDLERHISQIIITYGYIGIFAVAFIADLLVQPVGPDIPLVIGLMFTSLNPFLVFFSVILGVAFAIFISYFIGKTIGAAGIERLIGPKRFAKVQSESKQGKWMLFAGAISPIPYIPYLTGLFRLSFLECVLYVFLPRTFRLFVVGVLAFIIGTPLVNFILGKNMI